MGVWGEKCNRCGEGKGTYRGRCTKMKMVCSDCYDILRKEYGFEHEMEGYSTRIGRSTDFESYKLTDGNLKYVEHMENFDHENRGIWIESKRQEQDVLKRMGNRFAERGDNIQGHRFGYDGPGEGADRPEYKETHEKTQAFFEQARANAATVGLEDKDLKELTK